MPRKPRKTPSAARTSAKKSPSKKAAPKRAAAKKPAPGTTRSAPIYVWNPAIEHWQGADALGPGISVSIVGDGLGKAASLEQGLPIVERLRPKLAGLVREASRSMYRTYASHWADGEPSSQAAFTRALRLSLVLVFDDGSAKLYVDDADLFGGHAIAVNVSADLKFTRATLSG